MERYAILNEKQTYRNRNGSDYICKQTLPGMDGTILERTTDGWTLNAHGITLYDDGTIEWNYSTGGHWPHGAPDRLTASIRTACRGAFEEALRERPTIADYMEQQKQLFEAVKAGGVHHNA